MTGRLNPRRYDLGELRDVSRDRSQRPEPDRAAEARRTRAANGDDGTAVPVETTESFPERREESRHGRRPDESRHGRRATTATPTDAGTESEGDARSGDEPVTDDVEAYLRSRHRRRETESGRNGPISGQAAADRETTGGRDAAGERWRPREAGPQAAREGDYPPNAAAFLAELSGPGLSKPYLDRLPDAYSAQLEVFEWLERLLESGGHDATLSALEYYESIGWLSERSREELEDVVAGLPEAESVGASLRLDDHRESLLYVARLAQRRTR